MREIAQLTLMIALVAGWSQVGYAQDSLDQAAMVHEQANAAHALTICSAYFLLLSQLPGLPDSSKQGLEELSNLVGEPGQPFSTDREVFAATFRIAFEGMVDEMGK